jgi:CRISPR-associated protein Csd1
VGGGDALASFDKEAFCSFGLKQGANAAMSEQVVKTYTTALTTLIKTRGRKLGGAKVVYWYSGEVLPEDDPLQDLFGLEAPDDEQSKESEADLPPTKSIEETRRAQAENKARKLLTAIQSGERPDLANIRYFAVTVSGNAGRVVIRDWMEGSFAELATAIDDWFSDLAIIGRDGRQVIQSHKFGAVLAAPVRELKDATGPLVVTLWRCALKRQPIPHHVMARTLNRVRIDLMQGESARHARLGLLKAYCNRNERLPKMSNALNELETNPAYLCGRVMAILARIQKVALPGVGAGIVQRYYAAASATPALVLGRLIRNAQLGHLPKIESEGLRSWFDRRLADVWSQMKSPPPRMLSLEEQTLFAMGYYHQMADRGGSDSGAAQSPDQASE